LGFTGFAPVGCAHEVDDQTQGQQAIEQESENSTQNCAIAVGGFGHRHHQHHIYPSYGHQIHSNPLQKEGLCQPTGSLQVQTGPAGTLPSGNSS
jgi:hypothetical protein